MLQRGKLLKNCKHCGTEFRVQPYRKDIAMHCSLSCKSTALYPITLKGVKGYDLRGNKLRVGIPSANPFPAGHTPWNKDLKGTHFSPETEIKNGGLVKGKKIKEYIPIGTEKLRVHRGVKRWHVKVADPNRWELRARVVWEKHNGPIPKGKLIHHDDRDTENDDIDNLMCLTRAEHLKEHRLEIRGAAAA